MFKQVPIAAVAAMCLVASPALATGKGKTDDPNAAAPKEATAPAANAKTRYCIRTEPVTGSIRTGRVCKTADEWRAEGVDVSKPQSSN